jgi:predicted type IV restriction endonuclease
MKARLELANAIDIVRKRIQQIRDRKEIAGEQNTKAALIDPILIALGWDLQEMDESRREYRRKPQDNPVDYALFLNRTETLFIEAKSLERDLSDRKWISQNLSYATVVGVRWCVLTNGDEYRIYNSHVPVDVEQKLFRSVRISETANANSAADTLYLLSKDQMQGRLLDELWKAHFIDANVSRSIESLLANEDPGLIRLLHNKTKGVTRSEVRASLKRAKIRIDFPVPAVIGATPPGSTSGGKREMTAIPGSAARRPPEQAASQITVGNLIQIGLIRPPLRIERKYKGVHLTAVVRPDGKIEFEGEAYDSPSTAAGMARKSVIGAPAGQLFPQTNGWRFWLYSDEGGVLREIDELRQRFLAQRKLKIVPVA